MNTVQQKSFTLMELMVVIIIIGVLAGLAIPNYFKTVERGYYQDAINQIKSIHAANQVYYSRSLSYWPQDFADHDLADINEHLALNITATNLVYNCRYTAYDEATNVCSAYACTVTHTQGMPFTLTITQAPLSTTSGSENPECSDGNGCP